MDENSRPDGVIECGERQSERAEEGGEGERDSEGRTATSERDLGHSVAAFAMTDKKITWNRIGQKHGRNSPVVNACSNALTKSVLAFGTRAVAFETMCWRGWLAGVRVCSLGKCARRGRKGTGKGRKREREEEEEEEEEGEELTNERRCCVRV